VAEQVQRQNERILPDKPKIPEACVGDIVVSALKAKALPKIGYIDGLVRNGLMACRKR